MLDEAKTHDETGATTKSAKDYEVMPKTLKKIDLEELLNAVQVSFDPENDVNDRHVLYEVTGQTLADFSNQDPDIN